MSDGARHPRVETMAAFVEGTLPVRERDEVTAHLRGCADCRKVVAETARFYDEVAAPAVEIPSPRPRRAWLAIAAAVVLALLAAPFVYRFAVRSPIESLADAAPRDHRLIEARVSGFDWARLQAPKRGAAMPDARDLELTGAAGKVLTKTEGETTAKAQHAAGVAYLLIGRRSESIAALDRAANASNDARIWSDLAAVLYTSAVEEDRPSRFASALAAADRALRIDAKLSEAQFNRALILERLHANEQARQAWERYLELDPSSGWSTEAREHLRRLAGQSSRIDFRKALGEARRTFGSGNAAPLQNLAAERPQEARSWAEGPLLAEWASTQDEKTLAAVRLLARTIAKRAGESMTLDAVDAIDRGNRSQRAALAEAYALYDAGRIDYRNRDLGAAEAKLQRAAERFRVGGSPMALVATHFALCAAIEQSRGDEARAQLVRLASSFDPTRYPALAAQIHWELAVCANVAGDWGTGAREASAGAAIFRAIGESENASDLESLAAHALELGGEGDAAWRRRLAALADLADGPHRARRATLLHEAALSLASRDDIPAARSILELAIDDSRDGNSVVLATALADQARLACRDGAVADARQSVSDARATLARVGDGAQKTFLNGQIDLASATIDVTSRAPNAMTALDRVVEAFEKNQFAAWMPDVLLERARAARASGDQRAASAGYAAAMQEVERQRQTLADSRQRVAFLDTAAQIVDETVALDLARGDVASAFDIADRPRRRRLGAAAAIPPHAAVVEYQFLPDALAIFRATSGGVTAVRVPVTRHELALRIAALDDGMRRRADVSRETADLYRLLIAPLDLRGVDDLVIVPDRELGALPFAALQNGTYLAEQVAIRFAPSAADASFDEAVSPRRASVVADPFDPQLPRLEHAREEAAQIASLYGGDLIVGDDATPRRFAFAAEHSDVFHYAGHAESDAAESIGGIVLTGGAVTTNEIAKWHLAARPLVVLSACGSLRGNTAHVAGMSSLARAFIDAGARAVVGTLWDVDDDLSAPLLIRFHQELRHGAQPARALREAQLSMLRSADPRARHPAAWSGAELLTSR